MSFVTSEGVASNIAQNAETVVDLHLAEERMAGRHQRTIERVTGLLGRPWLLYALLAFASLWIYSNLIAHRMGYRAWDPPPFGWLQMLAGLGSLLVAVTVLITQNRQMKVHQRQAHLNLQLALLLDQRSAKVIELLESMRRDSPHLPDRVDDEADQLQSSIDPHEMVTILESRLEEVGENQVEYLDELNRAEQQAPGSESS